MLRPWYARIRTPWSVNAHGLPTNFVFESKSFRSDRPRVAHPRKGVHEVVHAAAVVREDPDAVERERAWVADELRVRIEQLLDVLRERGLWLRGAHGVVVPREDDHVHVIRH